MYRAHVRCIGSSMAKSDSHTKVAPASRRGSSSLGAMNFTPTTQKELILKRLPRTIIVLDIHLLCAPGMSFLCGCTHKIIDNVDASSYYAYGRMDFSPQEVVDHPCVRLKTE